MGKIISLHFFLSFSLQSARLQIRKWNDRTRCMWCRAHQAPRKTIAATRRVDKWKHKCRILNTRTIVKSNYDSCKLFGEQTIYSLNAVESSGTINSTTKTNLWTLNIHLNVLSYKDFSVNVTNYCVITAPCQRCPYWKTEQNNASKYSIPNLERMNKKQ